MRPDVLALAALLLAVLLAPVASAKAPHKVEIYGYESGLRIATIEDGEDLLAVMDGLYGPEVVRELLPGRAPAWHYRVLVYWGTNLENAEEMRYLLPQGREPGVICCVTELGDAFHPDREYVLRSPGFDAVMNAYVPAGLPPSGSLRPSATAMALTATAAIASLIGIFATVGRRSSRVGGVAGPANGLSEPSA